MYTEKYAYYKEAIEKRLTELIANDNIEPLLNEAMAYSLLQGGKRLRPVLALAANELMDGDMTECLPLAAAIEMVHTYSLIHDDLPAMDNSDLRRSKPTNHKVYGDDTAVLAGDALLNYAFEIALGNAIKYSDNAENHLKAINFLATAAGATGMISGQSLDLNKNNIPMDKEYIISVHEKKTGALIIGSLKAGLQLGSPTEIHLEAIETFGYYFGLAFQVVDDILDVTQDTITLGKDENKDAQNGKLTFPAIYGLETSRAMAKSYSTKAIETLNIFGDKAWFLKELSAIYLNREH